MRIFITSLLISVLLLSPALAHESWDSADLELLRDTLAQAGLTPETMRLDIHDRAFYGGDRWRLPFFDALIDDPLKISPYTRTLTTQLVANAGDLGGTLCSLQQRTSTGVRLGLIGDVLEPYRERCTELGELDLAAALAALDPERDAGYYRIPQYATIPAEVRNAAAALVFALADALEYRRVAVDAPVARLGCDQAEVFATVLDYIAEDDSTGEDTGSSLTAGLEQVLLIEALLEEIDYGLLNTGATLLAIAAQDTADALVNAGPVAGFHYAIDTPLGAVLITADPDAGTNAQDGHQLLVISMAGDNNYAAGGSSSSFAQSTGVLIDTTGNDNYAALQPSAFGCGIFGYGLLIDCAGDDAYICASAGLGCGLFGTGVLCDYSGDDAYSGVGAVQGSGTFGTGLLVDRDGDDAYHCYQLSQGYGFTCGAGLLLDISGNDCYAANDADIRFPAAQSAEHNSSLSQGFGFGRRGDYNDGHGWAGGVGMLVDGSGNDNYSCGIFGQGCGYWYGTGILADKSGNDAYHGQWYCQGSGAHFALGILQDDAGDDSYSGVMNMCTGAGHDFSLGWLEDRSGNDKYRCPNLSLGAGNANGIGVFWDRGGADDYLTRGTTLGQASGVRPDSLRDHILTLGVFIDGGGKDTYRQDMGPDMQPVRWPFAGNGLFWVRPGRSDPALPAEKGCAADAH